MRILRAAVFAVGGCFGLTVALGGVAGAVTFDFSDDEISFAPGAPAPPIDVDFISLAGITFSVAAFEGATPRDVTLFDPDDGTFGDADLDPLDIDPDPIITAGVQDPSPIGAPGGSDPDSGTDADASLIVQNPNDPDPNDLAADTRIEFTLESNKPILLKRLSFVDDVNATIIDASGTIGDIVVDGPDTANDCASNGDSCVAGLLLKSAQIAKGDSFSVDFDGSGGVIGFEAIAVPVPASLPLSVTALAGLIWMGRRRRRLPG